MHFAWQSVILMRRCAWCDTEGFIRLEAEVDAAFETVVVYNIHRQRVGKRGNRNQTYEAFVKGKP